MKNEKTKVDEGMINYMKHILGLDRVSSEKIISGNMSIYTSYRNFAGYSYKEPTHEKMVELHYANVVYSEMFHEYIYSLNRFGIEYLENILGIKIICQHS